MIIVEGVGGEGGDLQRKGIFWVFVLFLETLVSILEGLIQLKSCAFKGEGDRKDRVVDGGGGGGSKIKILFYFILFYFILFYFILFYFILFIFILFSFILF